MASPTQVRRIKLGSQGLEVSAQGLGCMSMSAFYGPPKPDYDMVALIHHAVRSGATFLDTSDSYGPFTNERLVGMALREGGLRGQVQLATKFGFRPLEDGSREICGDPAYVRAACEASLERLGVDCIDLYYQHRIDTRVPIEVTMGELKKLVEEGKIQYIGLSEASASTIRRAHAVHPIAAVQIEWSLWTRDVEEDIVPTCRELGIGIVAYSPLGRGFFSYGPNLVDKLSEQDFRKVCISDILNLWARLLNEGSEMVFHFCDFIMDSHILGSACQLRVGHFSFCYNVDDSSDQSIPRFQAGNLDQNARIFERVNEMAVNKGCTPSQLALAWVHHQGDDVCPIPGTTKIENLNQNIGALSMKLTPEEMAELESFTAADAVKGDRYHSSMPTWKSSETPTLSSWNGK